MKLHGPQDDRDKHWTGRWENQRSDLTRKEAEAYEGELGRLRNENKTLKDQLNRTFKELKAYQVKYPSPYAPKPIEDEEGNTWTIAPEAVNPLMEAYDTRILELEDTVKQQLLKLENFKEQMERLVTENEEFRNKHLEDLKNSADHSFGVNSPLSNELMNQLQERVQILADENALLVEQKIVLSTELDQQQSQAEKQFNEIGLLNARIADSQKELKDLHQKIVGLQFERDEAAKHALHCSDALGKAEQEIESLTDQITLCRQKQKETELEFNELKKQLKNMSLKHDEDGMSSLQKVKFAEDRVKELHLLLSAKTQELDATNEVLRKLRSEYQSTRQDAEGMLQVMTGMERQLNEYAAREEQVNKLASESRQKMEEAITVREQAAVREEQSRREIERLMAERKAHALQRQADIEKAVELVRKNMADQVAYYEQELAAVNDRNASLVFEAERAARESKSTREIFERLERVHEEQHSSAQHHLQELAAQLEAVTTARETERAQKIDMQEQNKELRQIIDKYRAQTEGNKQQLSQLEKAKDQEMTGIKQTNKELSKELSDKQRQLSKLHKENEELAHQLTTLSSQQERRFQDELNVLKLRLTEMEKLNKELDTLNQTNDVRLQMLVEQLKEKYNLQVLALEAKLRGEMEKNKTLLGRARNQELLMEDLQDQKHNLTRLVEETREALRGSEEEKIHFQARIQELAMKLVESHNAREEGVYRAARAIEELNINGLSPLRSSFSPKKLFGHEGKDDVLVNAADLQGQRSQESVDLVNSIVKASFDTQK